jgi:predicted Zn-dependent protease
LRDFVSLAFAVVAIAAAAAAVVVFTADRLAPYLAFETEVRLAGRVASTLPDGGDGEVQKYLQALGNRLAQAQDLPPEMRVTIHFQDGPTVNAFATLGGHVVIHGGLIRELPSENALAMVIAHEIGHVQHRHPVRALGRGLALGVILSTVSTAAGNAMAQRALGDAGLLTTLTFNRSQEEEADATALAALVRVYGHAAGAAALFEVLREAAKGPAPPRMLSTHPLSGDRITHIRELAAERGWALSGAPTAIPSEIMDRVTRKEPQ